MSKSIPLTRGQSTLVDDDTYDWLSRWKWALVGDGYAGRFDRSTRPPKIIYMGSPVETRDITQKRGTKGVKVEMNANVSSWGGATEG